MKIRVFVLITIMIITIAENMLITPISQSLNISFREIIAIGITSTVIAIICLWLPFVPTDRRVNILLAIMLVAICYVGHQWAFYSADETVHLKDMKELLAMPEKPIYFTLDDYKYNAEESGCAKEELTSKQGRGHRYVSSINYYRVMPLYTDSTTEEAKVWIGTKNNVDVGNTVP